MQTVERDTVCAYIVSADGKLLLGRKDPAKGGVYVDCWHNPGGGIDGDETREQAIIREVIEETGLDISQETLQLIDDEGRGESIKQRPNGPDVLVKMTFAVFKVRLSKPSTEIMLAPSDDLINLTWFDLDELDNIKQTPPGVALFERIGTDWLRV